MNRPPPRIGAYKEAVKYWRTRQPRREQDLEKLTDENADLAFTLAGVTQLDLVTQVWEALDRAIENGTSFGDFKKQVSEDLADAWGGEEPYRVENIFRTNVQTAYNAGRWEQMQDPEVQELRPYNRFVAVLDNRTTVLICRPLADTVLPADDPWWKSHWPPLHFACRSTVLPLTTDQGAEIGFTKKTPPTQAAPGFGATPDQKGYEPDLDSAPAQLVHALKTR